MTLIRKIRKKLSAVPRVKEVQIDRPCEIPEWLHWGSRVEKLRLFLPAEMLRMYGAFAYRGGVHPFLEALTAGPEALARFYEAHQPVDVAGAHFIDASAPALGPSELPWISLEDDYAYRGEKGLTREHGISMHGPCSREKVALEMSRLTRLRESILRRGYAPDRHGDIQGLFLRRGDEYRFFVQGGKHRAAVLAFLGCQKIPVAFMQEWPRVADATETGTWPKVRQGRIEPSVAQAVFDSYFDFDGREQYRRLGLTAVAQVMESAAGDPGSPLIHRSAESLLAKTGAAASATLHRWSSR